MDEIFLASRVPVIHIPPYFIFARFLHCSMPFVIDAILFRHNQPTHSHTKLDLNLRTFQFHVRFRCLLNSNQLQGKKALYTVFLLRMFVYTFGFVFMYPWFFGREMKKACFLKPLWPFARYILYTWI